MKACYVHVPFCRDICSYCDFTRCRYHAGLADKWLKVIRNEIISTLPVASLKTMYIGGGTPSALSNKQLEMLLSTLKPYTSKIQEYTLEANVDSLTDENLTIMKTYGINRISLGVQTLQPDLLAYIQRVSTRKDALQAIQSIHAHDIRNISIDLMYGLPGQTMKAWMQDVRDVVENFDIEHISLYSLTIEEHSQFGRDNVLPAEEGLEADMFEYARKTLQAHGFEHYEVSNFAKNKQRSKHNQMYWHYEDFLGIGCGASGKVHHKRYDNTCNLQTYLEQGPSPEVISLTKEDEMFETIMMGLRMSDGISLQRFQTRYSVDFITHYEEVVDTEIKKGMLQIENGYLKTTERGMLLLHDVLIQFLK